MPINSPVVIGTRDPVWMKMMNVRYAAKRNIPVPIEEHVRMFLHAFPAPPYCPTQLAEEV